ncbi:MAG: hypothetical protein R2862_02885 [Thermoanaerobaculia bacterium]
MREVGERLESTRIDAPSRSSGRPPARRTPSAISAGRCRRRGSSVSHSSRRWCRVATSTWHRPLCPAASDAIASA